MRRPKAAHLYYKILTIKGLALRLRKNRICIFL